MYDGLVPIVLDEFLGMFSRDISDNVPPNHAVDSQNNRFIYGGVKTREGSSLTFAPSGIMKRFHSFQLDPGSSARLYMYMYQSGANTIIKDSVGTTILSIADLTITDFSILNINGKTYITLHNGTHGKNFVYVYTGIATRKIAGFKPSSAVSAATGAAGTVEAGQRLFATAFESDTGFITKPNATWTLYTGPGAKKVDLTNIPTTGDTSIVKVHILCTKKIVNYSGNQKDYELFFTGDSVAEGTTTLTVDFYDSELVSSADYLNDVLEEVPGGTHLYNYNGRLVVSGNEDTSVTAFMANSLPLVSKSGNFESFSSVDGFCIANPGDIAAGGVRVSQGFRGNLYFLKANRILVTRDDNVNPPSSWPVIEVDSTYGCGVYGVATIADGVSIIDDSFLILSRAGLVLFNGAVVKPELTWKVKNIWDRINYQVPELSQVIIDPDKKCIYISLPLDGSSDPNYILYGDYSSGMSADTIKWDLWKFPTISGRSQLKSIDQRPQLAAPGFVLSFGQDNIYFLDTAVSQDFSNVIDSFYDTAYLGYDNSGALSQFNAIRLKVQGSGSLLISSFPLSGVESVAVPLAMPASITRDFLRKINVISEKSRFKFRVNAGTDKYTIARVSIYGQIYAEDRPQ